MAGAPHRASNSDKTLKFELTLGFGRHSANSIEAKFSSRPLNQNPSSKSIISYRVLGMLSVSPSEMKLPL
jgi:hypothetical protein